MFLTVLAWIVGPLATFMSIAIIIMAWNYEGSLEQMADRIHGVRRTFTLFRFLIPAMLSWAWLISRWVA